MPPGARVRVTVKGRGNSTAARGAQAGPGAYGAAEAGVWLW